MVSEDFLTTYNLRSDGSFFEFPFPIRRLSRLPRKKKEETLDRELDYLMLRPPLKNIKSYNSFKKLIKDYVQPERSSLLLLVVSSQLPIIY